MKKNAFLILLLLYALQVFANQNVFVGCWIGKIEVLRQELAFKICFERDSLGKLVGKVDIPQQNSYNLPLSNILAENDSIKFDLVVNIMNVAKFAGRISNANTDSAKIAGTFRQMGFVGKFELEKNLEEETEENISENYYEEEVEINYGNIKLAGTFSKPMEKGKFPTAIFITGSGLQNRDEEIFGFKIFKLLSNVFLKNNIATLRMDDRGIGGSKTIKQNYPKDTSYSKIDNKESNTELSETSTTFDYATDVEEMIKYLKGREDVDTNNLGLIGHSEGAIVAFIVASRNKDVKFVISLAGPTIRGDSLLLEQIKLLMKHQNAPDSLITDAIKAQTEIYSIIRYTKDYEKAKEILRDQAKKQLAFYPEEVSTKIQNSMIERNIQVQIDAIRSKWFETFIDIAPIDYLVKIECPVLLLFAERDTQVPAKVNIEHLQKNLNKSNFTIRIIPTANHLFQKCKTGQVYEYAILPKKFAPGFIETINSWIKANIFKQQIER
jgi:dienelactone hydrolase